MGSFKPLFFINQWEDIVLPSDGSRCQGSFWQVHLGQVLRFLAVCQVQRVEAQTSCAGRLGLATDRRESPVAAAWVKENQNSLEKLTKQKVQPYCSLKFKSATPGIEPPRPESMKYH